MLRSSLVWPILLLAACSHAADDDDEGEQTGTEPATASASHAFRRQLDGRGFPDGVLALTWDDGPDVHTLALASYLASEHVSGTFFVVGEWTGASSDPGFGPRVRDTGHLHMPVLGDLVAMGHRVGNHTLHHALLGRLDADAVLHELGDAQAKIDPFIRDEQRLFRVPGGDWTGDASRAVDGDGELAHLVGPFRWDVDAKDWEASVYCESQRPSQECEHADGRFRVRAEVVAQRYFDAIEARRRGIVLMHDRVGDVGTDYALDVAHALIPRLVARGYVFAAPTLGFSPMHTRVAVATCADLRLGDIDGDGHVDACVRDHDRVTCSVSRSHVDEHGLSRVAFEPQSPSREVLLPAVSYELADVSGDGRADVCFRTATGITCSVEGALRSWSTDFRQAQDVRYADVDGDGKADICGRVGTAIVCARSTGASFETARVWLGGVRSRFVLGDVNGDGAADACFTGSDGVECALASGGAFARAARWSHEPLDAIELGDINGDGRSDLCAAAGRCALSNGRAFTASRVWLDEQAATGAEWGRLGDINGDGRSDLCDCDANGVRCAVAP